ncbi:Elongator subunit elp2 [Nowakowskiella sp. JEL0407]|nr:Elongator subunit elp2 [Nowakowskiella sp. JEL0407]
MQLKGVHSSAACVRSPSCLDLSRSLDLVAYAANHSVALVSLNNIERGVFSFLHGHTKKITALKFLKSGSSHAQSDIGFITTSADSTARIWTPTSDPSTWNSITLQGHSDTVTCVGVARGRDLGSDDVCWIVTGSVDATLRIWKFTKSTNSVECAQIIKLTGLPLSLAITFLPNSYIPVILAGLSNSKLTLYIYNITKSGFIQSLALPGHTDWITSIDVATFTSTPDSRNLGFDDGDLLISTGSQDKFIRIWKISDVTKSQTVPANQESNGSGGLTQELLDSLLDAEGKEGGVQLSTKAHLVSVNTSDDEIRNYTVMFDALLLGHEDWVHSVHFQPAFINEGEKTYTQPLQLLSASADKSLLIWTPDTENNGVWNTLVRLGEIGGTNTLGFMGASFAPNESEVEATWFVAYGYNGAVSVWKEKKEEKEKEGWIYIPKFEPKVGLSGHFEGVENLEWDPSGEYLLTVSLDQTARIIAPWRRQKDGNVVITWHEICRPQIHGYDIHCVAFVNKYMYVCGSDEKVLRVFQAPQNFLKSLENLTGQKEEQIADLPIAATVPALGLSNKTVNMDDLKNAGEAHDFRNLASYTTAVSTPAAVLEAIKQPPFEAHLLQNTLWPEINKL